MFEAAVTITALAALIAGLLAIPVVIVLDVERDGRWRARWHVSWLFGVLNVRSAKRNPASSAAEAVEPRTRGSTSGRKRGGRVFLAVLRARGFVRRVVPLARALFRKVRFDRFHLDATFGMGDPADTGLVYGCVSPVFVQAGIRGLDVQCTPLFLESGLRGVLGATVRIRPLSIVGTIVAFLLSPPAIRAMRAAWRARA
jgi:hypothetical protein